FCFFFFQAEDGIRDFHVTGVQTCALPIYPADVEDRQVVLPLQEAEEIVRERQTAHGREGPPREAGEARLDAGQAPIEHDRAVERSEERRVGKEWRARWAPYR